VADRELQAGVDCAVFGRQMRAVLTRESIFRFGLYELDKQSAELRRSGMKLRLQEQPFQVLVKLIEHRGEVVSREELRSALWHGDTFVDFETGLNTAVKRLRETLGDSADNPTFIETVPRRGYRFIAQVDGPAIVLSPRSEEPAKGRTNWKVLALILGTLCILIGAYSFWWSQPSLPILTGLARITNDGRPKNPLNPHVSDDIHLYFTEGMTTTVGSGIAQVSTAGGETTFIPSDLKYIWTVASVSPDKSQLLVGQINSKTTPPRLELWIQPLPAGTPHRVGNINAFLGTWTPDGNHIVYAENNSIPENGSSIKMAKTDGSDHQVLAKVKGVVFSTRFSPDGKHIRFDLTDPKTLANQIWEMDANGQNVHPVFANMNVPAVQGGGRWSADGKYYYFNAGTGPDEAIWVMQEKQSFFRRQGPPTRLISSSTRFTSPLPSTDGKRLFVLGEDPKVELVRYDLKQHRFDPYLSGLSAGPIDFSPDRQWIVYVSYPDMTLWRSRADGSEKMQLTFPPTRAYLPRWSPDGKQIVFMDARLEKAWSIALVSPQGSAPETLYQYTMRSQDPTWDPDQKSVVFSRLETNGSSAIYCIDLQTKNLSLIPGSEGLFSPRVSPDGRYISALRLDDSGLLLLDRHANRWEVLKNGEDIGYNEWSHDGRYVYFRETINGSGALARIAIKNHAYEDLLSLKDFPQSDDGLAWWIGLTPDDSPLLMRNRSVQEIYALNLKFK
jgi:Tol biopolymer transport system component/DNA-binding winged helix-turn-helix (wHTH) protein